MPLLACGDVPNLHLSEAGRVSADGDQSLSIGREYQAVDTLGEPGKPRNQTLPGFMQQDFAITRDREEAAVGRIGQRREHGRRIVNGGRIFRNGRPRVGARRSVVLSAFPDPAPEQLDLVVGKRLAAERHLGFGLARQIADRDALLGAARDESRTFPPASLKIGEGGYG